MAYSQSSIHSRGKLSETIINNCNMKLKEKNTKLLNIRRKNKNYKHIYDINNKNIKHKDMLIAIRSLGHISNEEYKYIPNNNNITYHNSIITSSIKINKLMKFENDKYHDSDLVYRSDYNIITVFIKFRIVNDKLSLDFITGNDTCLETNSSCIVICIESIISWESICYMLNSNYWLNLVLNQYCTKIVSINSYQRLEHTLLGYSIYSLQYTLANNDNLIKKLASKKPYIFIEISKAIISRYLTTYKIIFVKGNSRHSNKKIKKRDYRLSQGNSPLG